MTRLTPTSVMTGTDHQLHRPPIAQRNFAGPDPLERQGHSGTGNLSTRPSNRQDPRDFTEIRRSSRAYLGT
jgi:hypothetical protein